MPRTLVITNDFPPRKGGIQTFIFQLLTQLYPQSVVVYTSNWSGASEYDRELPYPVIRIKSSMLLPTPRRMREIKRIIRKYECDQVLFGALAPLGLLSQSLKRLGISNIVAITHGHEAGWAKIPLLRLLLKLSAKNVDVITYLTQYTKDQISPLLNSKSKLVQLTPAVDPSQFMPVGNAEKAQLKKKYDLADKLVLLGLSRLMPRKGFDSVIRVLPSLLKDFPNLIFVIAGGGPDQVRLTKLVRRMNLSDHVKFLGAIPYQDLSDVYNLGDVFVMPCRSRFAGLDIEGFGIVYLEAAATQLPVLAGNSGGAVEAVIPGVTGELVDSNNLFAEIHKLLSSQQLREDYGQAGRNWIIQNFSISARGETLRNLLEHRSK